MAISKPTNWGNIAGKPTTVAGLGISDFAAQAIAAQAGITSGAVGTYMIAISVNAWANIGATIAGSSLRSAETGFDLSQAVGTSALAGTWRAISSAVNNVSNASGPTQYGPALYMRIA